MVFKLLIYCSYSTYCSRKHSLAFSSAKDPDEGMMLAGTKWSSVEGVKIAEDENRCCTEW